MLQLRTSGLLFSSSVVCITVVLHSSVCTALPSILCDSNRCPAETQGRSTWRQPEQDSVRTNHFSPVHLHQSTKWCMSPGTKWLQLAMGLKTAFESVFYLSSSYLPWLGSRALCLTCSQESAHVWVSDGDTSKVQGEWRCC